MDEIYDGGDELTNEEILELMSKPNPHGLEPFGENWEKEMDMHPLFMDSVPQEVIDGGLQLTAAVHLIIYVNKLFKKTTGFSIIFEIIWKQHINF